MKKQDNLPEVLTHIREVEKEILKEKQYEYVMDKLDRYFERVSRAIEVLSNRTLQTQSHIDDHCLQHRLKTIDDRD